MMWPLETLDLERLLERLEGPLVELFELERQWFLELDEDTFDSGPLLRSPI